MATRKPASTGRPKNTTFDLDDMLGLMAAGLNNPKPNNHQYEPHEKQLMFHRSQKNGRQYIGGNRSGKTTGGINEDIWWLTGRHPFVKLPPPPIIGRLTTVDFKNGVHKIILPQLSQWIPPSDLVNGSWTDSYDAHKHILTLANDSELEIMSYEQDLEKFAGVPRHFIHFDEEPPFDIFKECKARLVDYNGRWWMTMTPVDGMTWTMDEIYEKRGPLVEVVEVDIWDNPHITEEAIAILREGYDEDEWAIRGSGKYIHVAGLVFKQFDSDIHVIPPVAGAEGPREMFREIPNANEYEHWISLDQGFANPTAILFHAVHKKTGDVITYAEHYQKEWTIQQHAEFLLQAEAFLRKNYGIIPFLHVADPAIKQRTNVTGLSTQVEYGNHGVNWALGATKDVNAGLDKMNNYLRLGKWFIMGNCVSLIKEIKKYRRSQYATSNLREKNNRKEEPQKKDDHAIDSTRYFFSFMPDLNPQEPAPEGIVRPNLLGAPTVRVGGKPYIIDENLLKPPSSIHIIQDYDEFVGEW